MKKNLILHIFLLIFSIYASIVSIQHIQKNPSDVLFWILMFGNLLYVFHSLKKIVLLIEKK